MRGDKEVLEGLLTRWHCGEGWFEFLVKGRWKGKCSNDLLSVVDGGEVCMCMLICVNSDSGGGCSVPKSITWYTSFTCLCSNE